MDILGNVAGTRIWHGPLGHSLWLDGRLIPNAATALATADLAFTRGYAAFEALRTYGKTPFLAERHFERLAGSCEILRLTMPTGIDQLCIGLDGLLAANQSENCLIKVYITGGVSSGFTPAGKEQLIMLTEPIKPFPEKQMLHGVNLASSSLSRSLPQAKSTDYLVGVRETILAREKGHDEVIFVDRNGNILEGTTFNIFTLKGRKLTTPSADVLKGITAEHLLSLASTLGFEIIREAISRRDVADADEIFITSTTREIMPVAAIDGEKAGANQTWPGIRELQDAFRASAFLSASAEAWQSRIGLAQARTGETRPRSGAP